MGEMPGDVGKTPHIQVGIWSTTPKSFSRTPVTEYVFNSDFTAEVWVREILTPELA